MKSVFGLALSLFTGLLMSPSANAEEYDPIRLTLPMTCAQAQSFVDENRYIDLYDKYVSWRAYLFPIQLCDGVGPMFALTKDVKNCAIGCGPMPQSDEKRGGRD